VVETIVDSVSTFNSDPWNLVSNLDLSDLPVAERVLAKMFQYPHRKPRVTLFYTLPLTPISSSDYHVSWPYVSLSGCSPR